MADLLAFSAQGGVLAYPEGANDCEELKDADVGRRAAPGAHRPTGRAGWWGSALQRGCALGCAGACRWMRVGTARWLSCHPCTASS